MINQQKQKAFVSTLDRAKHFTVNKYKKKKNIILISIM